MGDIMTEESIWEQAKQVPPSATKENKSGGFDSTSINGYWFFQKATEMWGPIGTGWGYDILEETFTDGVPIRDPGSKEIICHSVMHTIKISLWYPDCEKPVVQYGHTPYIIMTQKGPKSDMEVMKKSLTDAIKKALSMLGFAADVYMGDFADIDYKRARIIEEQIETADNKAEEIEIARKSINELVANNIKAISTAMSKHEAIQIETGVRRTLHFQKDIEELRELCDRGEKAIIKARTERVAIIDKGKQEQKPNER